MREGENILLFLCHGLGRASRSFFQHIFLSIYPHQTKRHRGQHKIFFSLTSPPLHHTQLSPLSLLNFPFSPLLSFISSYYSHALHLLLSLPTFIPPPLILSSSILICTAFIFSSVRWIGKEDPTADLATTPFSGFVGTPPSLIFALPTANSPWYNKTPLPPFLLFLF